MHLTLADVPGIRVGHWTDEEGGTGCTVVLCGAGGAVAGVDVRGSAPGTRETDLLAPKNTVQRVHAVCLAGGSAFGLAAADGVMRYLRDRKIGIEVGPARIPIVPGAVIFDPPYRSAEAYPDSEAGYAACLDAEREGVELREGSVGAGTGATVGKLLGLPPSKGGVGTAARRLGEVTVGALAVCNAAGDVVDEHGRLLAAGHGPAGELVSAWERLLDGGRPRGPARQLSNTTLGVVATDAKLSKVQCQKLAELAQDALALAIRPVHTMADGDTVFALSTGERELDFMTLGVAAVTVLREAVERSVRP